MDKQTRRGVPLVIRQTMKTNSRFLPFLAAALLLLPVGGAPCAAREPGRTLADLTRLQSKVEAVAAKVTPATVALLSGETESSGSGVVTSADGLILTAAHVVQGSKELMVVFPNGKQVRGKVLGANYSKDLAMVRIEDKGPWPFVERGVSRPLQAGDWVVAMGHSAGFDPNRPPPVRFGRVISKGPGNFLTTDCTLIGGDSGGPLFDLEGRIVAINSNIGRSVKNNNHAGVDGFALDWDRMLAGEQWGRLSLDPIGNPESPALGIEMGPDARAGGVFVGGLVPHSPAAAAGVRLGDLIKAVDGSAIEDGNGLIQVLAKKQSGDTVRLSLVRDNKSLEINVTLEQRARLFRDR
jgi:serine protease Do